MTKLTKISLGVTIFGLFTVSMMFVYYGLHLGIKPCKDIPSDASNCGDADFGGVYFIGIGGLITLIGLISLFVSVITTRFKRNRL